MLNRGHIRLVLLKEPPVLVRPLRLLLLGHAEVDQVPLVSLVARLKDEVEVLVHEVLIEPDVPS